MTGMSRWAGDRESDCATVCVMSENQARPRVGVRELRQNLSVYLRRVKDGESLEVTEQGRPVARLIPLAPSQRGRLAEMIEDGRATRPKGDLLDRPPLKLGSGPSVVDLLVEMRDEDER